MEEGSLFQRMKQIFHEDEMDEEMQKEAETTESQRTKVYAMWKTDP